MLNDKMSLKVLDKNDDGSYKSTFIVGSLCIDDLDKLNTSNVSLILESIRKEANHTIVSVLPIMKELKYDENDYVDILMRDAYFLSEDKALKLLRASIIKISSDASSISESLANVPIGSDATRIFRSCKLLQEAWSGDAFDAEGEDGLMRLLDSLQTQRKQLKKDEFLKTIISIHKMKNAKAEKHA